MQRVAIIASASGNGKTTLARALGRRLSAPVVELDALVHGPGWTQTPDDELRAGVEAILAGESWVIDGTYRSKLGDLVLRHADTVVWLDLPVRVWLPRLLRRSVRRLLGREPLWNENRETLRGVLLGRDALIPWAFRSHYRRRRHWPHELASQPVVRLRSLQEVAHFLEKAG